MMKPPSIRIEASSACQLKCPSCPTGQGLLKTSVGSGFLKFKDFQNLIDKNSWVKDIELSNWGEIFLNPGLIQIMQYAHEKGVRLTANNGVNFNTASDEVLEGLVKYQFASLNCSIDGASADTYAIYRRQGSFENVIANIKKVNLYKAKYNSPYPQLRWQFVVFGHNEHEIAAASAMAAALDMAFYVKLSWDEDFSPIKDLKAVASQSGLGVASRTEFEAKFKKSYLGANQCAQLWIQPQINFDGRVLGCCVNTWGDFGNAFSEGLEPALNNETINRARQMLLGKLPALEGIPCTSCSHYTKMQETGNWLSQIDLKLVMLWRWVQRTLPPSVLRVLRLPGVHNILLLAYSRTPKRLPWSSGRSTTK